MVKKAEYLHHERCQPQRYYGGKQAKGKAKWIAGLLPWRKQSMFCETHGGMMSVLVTRAAVKTEMYNDIDGRIVNWWEMLRLHTDRFSHDVEIMPLSRAEFERAHRVLADSGASSYDQAQAVQVILSQAITPGLNERSWGKRKSTDTGKTNWRSERVGALAGRIRYVQLECRPAIDVLHWLQSSEQAVIYCDPPYYSSDCSPYANPSVNVDALSEAVQAQAGKVAISGYGSEWDHLGWQRHERATTFLGVGKMIAQGAQHRIEVLWTNYDADVEGAAANVVAGEA